MSQATLFHANGTPASDVVRLGNITRAVNGYLSFPTLQVYALPGAYVLKFGPLDANNRVLQPALLDLSLRECMAGEAQMGTPANDTLRLSANINVKCEECDMGTYR